MTIIIPHPKAGCDLLDLLVVDVDGGLLPLDGDNAAGDLGLASGEQLIAFSDLLLQGVQAVGQAVQTLANLAGLQPCHR